MLLVLHEERYKIKAGTQAIFLCCYPFRPVTALQEDMWKRTPVPAEAAGPGLKNISSALTLPSILIS